VAREGSEVVLFEGDDQRPVGGEVPAGHQGGAIHFGNDGKLYVALGEQTAGAPSQRLDSLLGKMLRLNRDGSIPEDNPFFKKNTGKYRAIWAYGLRNPFTFAVQPETGRLLAGDVGGNAEEINEVVAGANYGWPTVEHGPTNDARFRGPIHWYPTSSVIAGAFCPVAAQLGDFPAGDRGRLFFADFMKGWIKVLDPDHPDRVRDFAEGLPRPVDLKFAPDGSLLVLLRDAWVKDDAFKPGTGSLIAIRHDANAPAPKAADVPVAFAPPPPLPTISPAPGTYTGPITVVVRLGVAGDSVRYTTDGSDPSKDSPIYKDPFKLEHSATVRARSFNAAGAPVDFAIGARYDIQGSKPYGLAARESPRGLRIPPTPAGLPARLSETGLFASLVDLTPSTGVIPYEVNAPLWSDGARKLRWIAVPGGATIGFRPKGEWTFPAGTVFVKHFEIQTDYQKQASIKRLETRLLVVDGSGGGYGVTYRWRADGREADLLGPAGASEELRIIEADGPRRQSWTYPGREDCLKCHTTIAGFVLGPKTRQLNREVRFDETGIVDNQLRAWNVLGLFSPAVREGDIPGFDRLVAVDDESAPLEHRVRSYLDANCMNCHRPGANIPSAFDARFDTPLAQAKVLDAPTMSDSLGIASPRVVAPGDPGRSLLLQRMVQTERFKMPPLARDRVDRAAIAALERWIATLPGR
jgi:uncharacterized repeat protein (TIGR03806 family)